jgi:hypothetical protein
MLTPAATDLLPAFDLPGTDGNRVRSRLLRGRLCTILLLLGSGLDEEWNRAVAEVEGELRDWGAELLPVVAAPAEGAARGARSVHAPVLIDADGALHRQLGAADAEGRPRPALLIVERGGAIRWRFDRTDDGPVDLTPAVEWARYLGIQEPECGTCVPAWPAEYR